MKKFNDTGKEKLIIKLYLENNSMRSVANQVNVSLKIVQNVLKRKGIKSRTLVKACRKYKLNDNVFENLNEESAYWSGFIMADGCITTDKRSPTSKSLEVQLHEKDVSHLEKLRTFLCSTRPVEKPNNRKHVRLRVTSSKISKDLEKYGILPRKSLNAAPSILINNNKHFWRGVIDGDGTVFVRRKKEISLGLIGSKEIIRNFKNYVNNIIIEEVPARIEGVTQHTFKLCYYGSNARKIIKHLYDESTIYLDRKKEIAKECLKLWGVEIN